MVTLDDLETLYTTVKLMGHGCSKNTLYEDLRYEFWSNKINNKEVKDTLMLIEVLNDSDELEFRAVFNDYDKVIFKNVDSRNAGLDLAFKNCIEWISEL